MARNPLSGGQGAITEDKNEPCISLISKVTFSFHFSVNVDIGKLCLK
jgi:hypothetical protein